MKEVKDKNDVIHGVIAFPRRLRKVLRSRPVLCFQRLFGVSESLIGVWKDWDGLRERPLADASCSAWPPPPKAPFPAIVQAFKRASLRLSVLWKIRARRRLNPRLGPGGVCHNAS